MKFSLATLSMLIGLNAHAATMSVEFANCNQLRVAVNAQVCAMIYSPQKMILPVSEKSAVYGQILSLVGNAQPSLAMNVDAKVGFGANQEAVLIVNDLTGDANAPRPR